MKGQQGLVDTAQLLFEVLGDDAGLGEQLGGFTFSHLLEEAISVEREHDSQHSQQEQQTLPVQARGDLL